MNYVSYSGVISVISLFFVRKTSKPANSISQNTENPWETEGINIIITRLHYKNIQIKRGIFIVSI